MCDINQTVAQLIILLLCFLFIKLKGGINLADHADVLYFKVIEDFPEDTSEDIVLFDLGEHEYYGLRYEYPSDKNNNNIFLVRFNDHHEYRDDGEYLQLSKGDIFKIYQENNSIFISLKGNEKEFYLSDNTNAENQQFSFFPPEQSTYLEKATKEEYKKFNKTYKNSSSSSKSDSESSNNVESIETSSEVTEETTNSETNSESVSETTAETLVSEPAPINNFLNPRSLIVIGIIVVFIITSVFLFFKFRKAKSSSKSKNKAVKAPANNGLYKYTIDNKTLQPIWDMLAYPITPHYNSKNEYEADQKNNFGALLLNTNSLDFRYSSQRNDKLIIQPLGNSYSSEKSVREAIQSLGKFILSYSSKEYRLIIGELNSSDNKSISITELRDYSRKDDTTIKDLVDIINKFLSEKNAILLSEQNPDDSPLQSMTEILKYIVERIYKPTQFSEATSDTLFLNHFISDFNEISDNGSVIQICKEKKIYKSIKLIIAISIETIIAKKNNAFFKDTSTQKKILRSLENPLLQLKNQIKEKVSELKQNNVKPDETASESSQISDNDANTVIVTPPEKTEESKKTEQVVVNQQPEPEIKQNDITPPKENIMDMYLNTSDFLASHSEIKYYSPSSNVTLFNSCDNYIITNAPYESFAVFVMLGNNLYLNPRKYKKAIIKKDDIETLKLNLIFNLTNSPVNTECAFKFIKPAKVSEVINDSKPSLLVVEKGEIQF